MSPDPRSGGTLDAATLERILEVTRELAAPFDLNSMLARVIDAGRAVLGADRGTVFLYDAGADELVVSVATELEPLRIPADRGIVGECAQTRRIINVPDCYGDPRFNPEVDRKTGYLTRCLLSVPLIGYDDSLVGVLQLLNKRDGVFDGDDEKIAAALAAQCAVALQRVRMTEQLVIKERMDRELAVAREIQMGFLPREMPSIPGYDLAGTSRPADETGGDTFDVVRLDDDRTILLLGDATGHGVGPALSATQVRAMVRIAARLGADLGASYAHINDQLEEDLPANRFVTAFLGVLDSASNRVTYHSPGQGPILHFRASDEECEWLGSTGLPLGLMPAGRAADPETIELAPGDILGLITDGVFECADSEENQFGTGSVEHLVREHRNATMSHLTERLLEEVDRFAAGQPQADDITIVLVKRL